MGEGMRVIEAEIEGISDLLLHNGQLADPRNKWSKALKALTSQKKKTDDQHVEIQHVEFLGSLYWDPETGVYLPGEMLEAALLAGARKDKKGPEFKSAVFCDGDAALIYSGPRDPEALWEDGSFKDLRGVKIQRARCMRCRPKFSKGWRAKFRLSILDGAEVAIEEVNRALTKAGALIGLGDYRPRFGRFKVISFSEV
jgi:hypothetical protein